MEIVNVARGELLLRLARSEEEIHACQRLRYGIFYEELGARPDSRTIRERRDSDSFDGICDHLMVISKSETKQSDSIDLVDGELVATYRLLRQDVATANAGFYSQMEFDVAPLITAHPELRFLELGRSCVLRSFRTKPVLEILWQGIWNYVRLHRMDVMFGCASLAGRSPENHTSTLGLLAQFIPNSNWLVKALPTRHINMRRTALSDKDRRRAMADLPPLIKGYLRLGCFIGDGAVVDEQFNTIDVLIILPVSAIRPRYFSHFGLPAGS